MVHFLVSRVRIVIFLLGSHCTFVSTLLTHFLRIRLLVLSDFWYIVSKSRSRRVLIINSLGHNAN